MTLRLPISSDIAGGFHIRCYASVSSGGAPPIYRFAGVIRRSEFNPAFVPNPWANPIIASFSGRCIFRPSPQSCVLPLARLSAVLVGEAGKCLLHVRGHEAIAITGGCRATIRPGSSSVDLRHPGDPSTRCELRREQDRELVTLIWNPGAISPDLAMTIACPIASIRANHSHALDTATERSEVRTIPDPALNAALAATLAFQIADGVLSSACN